MVKAQSTTQVQFGKNKVQYHNFFWSYYESSNFICYFNVGGLELGRFAVQDAERNLDQIKEKLEYTVNNKIEILVYNNFSDFTQSNLGSAEPTYLTGGVTKTLGNKVFVYFDGNHQHLHTQIREGIAKVLMENILFGSNVQEVVQNAVLLNLPGWYTDGLVQYLAQPWSPELDDRLRCDIKTKSCKNFSRYTANDATFAGHSMWNFIEENYGRSSISNMLYITRINHSMEAGFLLVTDKGSSENEDDWLKYYTDRFDKESSATKDISDRTPVAIKAKRHATAYHFTIHPDGKQIAYASNLKGRYTVYLKQANGGYERILHYGIKNNVFPINNSYPLLSWSRDGKTLLIIYENKDHIKLATYEAKEKKLITREIIGFQKVNSISYGPDNKSVVMSANVKGQSDIYIYNYAGGKTQQLTDDFWDDINPYSVVINGKKGVVFASNRLTDTLRKKLLIDTLLPIKNFDAFFYNLSKPSNQLTRISYTPSDKELSVMGYGKSYVSFLSDYNGVINRFVARLDSVYDHTDTVVYYPDSTITNPRYTPRDSFLTAPNSIIDSVWQVDAFRDTFITYPITNFANNIQQQDISPNQKMMLELIAGKLYQVNLLDSTAPKATYIQFTGHKIKSLNGNLTEKKESPMMGTFPAASSPNQDTTTNRKILRRAIFQSEFTLPGDSNSIFWKDTASLFVKDVLFKPSKAAPYHLHMYTSELYTQFNTVPIIQIPQPVVGTSPQFDNIPLSFLTRVDVKDVFEDYQLSGGFNLPLGRGGIAYFAQAENRKKRLDKTFTYYRQGGQFSAANPYIIGKAFNVKTKTNYYEAAFKYPLDIFQSVHLIASERDDKYISRASDTFSLRKKTIRNYWGMLKAEYVFDNSIPVQLNIFYGWRLKLSASYFQRLDDLQSHYALLSFDIRNYQKVMRSMIWANRLAGSTSLGPDKMLYFLGGVDGWMAPRFDQTTPIDNHINYTYQSLATNLRGFEQNVRNGNSYAVWNSELRMPIYTMISRRPLKNNFVKNFQFIVFGDMGAAWNGISPYTNDAKKAVTDEFGFGPIHVEVDYYRNPLVGGYGWGMRSTLGGYFFRIDRAYGVDNRQVSNRIWYLSMSTDF